MQNKKPLGLVLIAIYCAIWGTAMIPLGCMSSMAAGVPGVPAYAGPFGMFVLAFGVAMIAGAYGIWTVQPWGRTYNIWLELATVPLNLLSLVGLMPGGKVTAGERITAIICLILTVVIVKYLTSDGVKRFFGQSAETM